jgi:sugar phosphate permease
MVLSSRVIDNPAVIKVSNVRWKILGLLCVASFVSYLLRSNISIIGETMVRELHITQIELGYILAAFVWGYGLFQFPGGIFGDVIGSRKALTLMAVLWGVTTILAGLVPAPPVISIGLLLGLMIVIRFLSGVFHAPIFPITGAVIANWFPPSGWAFPNGLSTSALTLGAAAAAPLIVWLADQYGWRQSFFLTSPLAFVIAVVWWWYARDYPAMHRSVNEAELQLINEKKAAPSDIPPRKAWRIVIKNRDILLLTLSYFCMNYIFYLVFNWFFFI